MDNVKKEINEAVTMLGAILLHGDAVDMMAAAKAKLRRAVKILEEEASGLPENPKKRGE